MRLIQTLAMVLLTTMSLSAQINARLFHQPDVSESHIVFAYGGDIWIVPKNGGMATKLSSPKGEESFPRFSPDGSKIAFSGNYDGNTDIYVMPSEGGVPVRVTHHGMSDRVLGWYPDGKSLLYASSMESGKQRFSQFYKVSASGGLPDKLPIAMGEFGSLSPDGSKIAFQSYHDDNWEIYIMNADGTEQQRLTNNNVKDSEPAWRP